jgi:hypothetical protein
MASTAQLTLVKAILNISDTSKDTILNHYITMAVNIANRYCNQILTTDYDDAIAELAVYIYQHKDNIGYSQFTEGDKEITYQGGIPDVIKESLPTPKLTIGV